MDTLSRLARSALMSKVGTKDTLPEKRVRRFIHGRGLRFKLHPPDLPGKPDIVLPKWKTIIFVHGCFWHGCSLCDHGRRKPKSNKAFWEEKIRKNIARDSLRQRELRELGWSVFVIWECQTRKDSILQERLTDIFPDGISGMRTKLKGDS